MAETAISKCIGGEFEIIPQTWTSNGYYTYICLSEVSFLKPVSDDDGWLQNQKKRIDKYPPKLKSSIISTFMNRAGTWMGNFHYDSAVRRRDILFTAPAVIHTIMDMIQVIFALNEVYFPGDKKLENELRRLPYCPDKLLDNLEMLLSASRDGATLRKQAEILKDIYRELGSRIK